LVAFQVLEQAVGLGKQALLGALFGTSAVMDAFIVALTIGGLIQVWMVAPIRQTLIPMFRGDLARSGERAAWTNAGTLLNNIVLILVGIVLLAVIAAGPLIGVIAPGLAPETMALAIGLARVTVISVLFFVVAILIGQIWFSYERFFWPGAAGTVNHLVTIGIVLGLGSVWGIYGLAVATVLGSLAELAVQLGILWEKRALYPRKVDLGHPGMREMAKLSGPLLLASGSLEVSRVTDRVFASRMPAGSLTALALSHRLVTVALEFVIRPMQRSVFPHLSRLGAEGDLQRLSVNLFEYLRVLVLVTAPMAMGVMLLSEGLVTVIYKRGAFDERSVSLTSQALALYAMGIPALTLCRALNHAFFALKDTRTPSALAVVRVIVKIVVAWLLIPRLGHLAIALAESLSEVVRAALLFIALPSVLKGGEIRGTFLSLGRSLAAALGMAAMVYMVGQAIAGVLVTIVEVIVLTALGVAAYAALGLLVGGAARDSVLKSIAPFTAKYLRYRS
jgi:putative peptidoglycan lipid II flippase